MFLAFLWDGAQPQILGGALNITCKEALEEVVQRKVAEGCRERVEVKFRGRGLKKPF